MSLIAVAAIFLLARLAPPLEGLSAQGQGVLGAMVAGAVLWITEATPIGLTAIIVVNQKRVASAASGDVQ